MRKKQVNKTWEITVFIERKPVATRVKREKKCN